MKEDSVENYELLVERLQRCAEYASVLQLKRSERVSATITDMFGIRRLMLHPFATHLRRPAGQLVLILSILCQSRKQHCQLRAAPLFSALSACDRYLLASSNTIPNDAGQLVLILSILCQSRKQHCQLRAAPLFSALSACDRYLLASSNTIPNDVIPLLNLLRDCGICNASLTLYKSCVTLPSNSVMNAVKEFETTVERFLDSSTVVKSTRDKEMLLSYSTNVVMFSLIRERNIALIPQPPQSKATG
ncbi:hypothetical protein DICVIV_13998 [Dictyocaulus viviparus]|uniref:Uncharacterized protein n=1 Tax=Dictyocaulus viviparus TaxID=29172 RepID=A0A0D8X8W6_DICVI|nr:hypothetical protein DICVIV_13998 [Dictyocaulus viviparus]